MRFDDSYRQKIDQMHLDDAFIAKLADQMTEAATNREHIEVMEMDPGQPGRHRRKWVSVAGTIAAAAAIIALTLNMTLPINEGVIPLAPGSGTGNGSLSDTSQELTSSILAVWEYPFTGTAFALYQDMEHTVDPEQYNRLESRINSWFYYDTEMPDGDPALHLSFLERVTEPAMQAWLMQMMTGFDQQENAKIQASGQELAFEGYNYDGFETKLEEAVLGEQTQAVLLTPNQDFTELSRNCRKISYLSDGDGTFCAMNGVASAGYNQLYYDVQEAAYTTTDNEVHWGVIVYEYLLTPEGTVTDASTGDVIGSYFTNDSYYAKMDLADAKYGSYDSGYTFELEQGTARTAYLFELTSPDANGDTFTLYNKYPLEQEGALVHVPNDTDDYTQLEDFIYYYAQRAATMPSVEDLSRITAKDQDFLVWALRQVEYMRHMELPVVYDFTLEEIEQYLQLTYNETITLPKDADYELLAKMAGVTYRDGVFSCLNSQSNIEKGGTILDRNSMQVTELDDGAFLVTADAYVCLQNQCYSMIDEEAAGTYRLENGAYTIQASSQYGCQHTRQYLFRMQAVTESRTDLKLNIRLEDAVLKDSAITSMQIISKDEMTQYLSTADDSPFSDDGTAANYPTTSIQVQRASVLPNGTLQAVDQRLIDTKNAVGIEYRTVTRHSVTLNLDAKHVDCYIYRHADGKLAAVTAPQVAGQSASRKLDLPAEAGEYTLIAVDRTNSVSYLCLVKVG